MSKERRHLRFLITSALLVGPAIGCGGTETDTVEEPAVLNTPVDYPIEVERDPTGNPGDPEEEAVERPPPEPEPEPTNANDDSADDSAEDATDESPTDTSTEDSEQSIADIAEEHPPRTNIRRPRPEPRPEPRPRINAPPLPSER